MVNQIMRADKQRTRLTPEQEQLLQKLQAEDAAMAELARAKWQSASAPQYKDRSFHYLPYHTDSDLEIDFLKEMLPDDLLKDKHLELYYNGDGSLTEFHIRCYQQKGKTTIVTSVAIHQISSFSSENQVKKKSQRFGVS